jgi:hypothetical protein
MVLGLALICPAAAVSAQETFNIVALLATSGPVSIYGGPTEKGLRMTIAADFTQPPTNAMTHDFTPQR